MYVYILGLGISCLVLVGIASMDTVYVKPAEVIVKAVLWPVTLVEAMLHTSANRHNFKAAL